MSSFEAWLTGPSAWMWLLLISLFAALGLAGGWAFVATKKALENWDFRASTTAPGPGRIVLKLMFVMGGLVALFFVHHLLFLEAAALAQRIFNPLSLAAGLSIGTFLGFYLGRMAGQQGQ